MNSTKDKILTGLLLVAALWFMVWVYINDSPPKINNPGFAIGTLIPKWSDLSLVLFKVNEKKYKAYLNRAAHFGNILGEKFLVVYEKEDPNKNIVLEHAPVFLKHEKYQESIGAVIRIFNPVFNNSKNIFKTNYYIDFKYQVNGKIYKRTQGLPNNYEKKYGKIEAGQKYIVRYWIKNPNRAIIYLDQPVK